VDIVAVKERETKEWETDTLERAEDVKQLLGSRKKYLAVHG
jgi:hypothetical protein